MKKIARWQRWVALAAMFALVLTSGLLIARFAGGGSGLTVVALDVNPSLELELNEQEEIVAARALNDAAAEVIGSMPLEGVKLEVAVYAIIGSMVTHGYLSVEQNSILISVNSGDAVTAASLKEKLTSTVNTMLENSNIQGSVLTQDFEKNKETDQLAEQNNISTAKAALISKIVAAGLRDANGRSYTYEVLARLNMNELKQILDSKALTVEGLGSVGTAGEGKNNISHERAMQIALEKAGVTRNEVTPPSVEVDYEDDIGALVYEVEFKTAQWEYEYTLLAKDGTVLEEEKEPNDDDRFVLPEGDPEESEHISHGAAMVAALNKAGVDRDQVYPSVELEYSEKWQAWVYEVEFETAAWEYEYVVAAKDGSILREEIEPNEDGTYTVPERDPR